MFNDDLVFLEACATKNLISYPQFISLNIIFQIFENATQKRIQPAPVYSSSVMSYSYMPTLHMSTYDFSTSDTFKGRIYEIDLKEAKQCLRIFVDFIKQEIQDHHKNDLEHLMMYEPLLTHLLNKKDSYLQ